MRFKFRKRVTQLIAYVKGTVALIQSDYIVIDVQGIGYQIQVGHPYEFAVDKEVMLYTYHHIREDISALYGFTTMEEKQLYIRLLSVKGVGPKVGMTILASTTFNMLVNAIESEDVAYLKKIPGIGPKAAGQIILDLKGKLADAEMASQTPQFNEAIEALQALGYTKKEIEFAMKDINDATMSVEDVVRAALKKIMG